MSLKVISPEDQLERNQEEIYKNAFTTSAIVLFLFFSEELEWHEMLPLHTQGGAEPVSCRGAPYFHGGQYAVC